MVPPATFDTAPPAADWAVGSSAAPTATNSTSAEAEAICHATGHVSQARWYHGRSDHSRTAASTRGSSVRGARGAGSCLSRRSTRRSRSAGCIIDRQPQSQGLAPAMDVRLHLAERHAEELRDVLVAHLVEVKQDERHTLVIG